MDEYITMNKYLMEAIENERGRERLQAIQTKVILDILFAAGSRSDESLSLRFSDFYKPEVQPFVGPCVATLHKIVAGHSKTGNKAAETMPMLEHLDVDLCPVFAICMYIYEMYGVLKEKFPDPEHHYNDQWLKWTILHAADPAKPMTYDTQNKLLKDLYKQCQVILVVVSTSMHVNAHIYNPIHTCILCSGEYLKSRTCDEEGGLPLAATYGVGHLYI